MQTYRQGSADVQRARLSADELSIWLNWSSFQKTQKLEEVLLREEIDEKRNGAGKRPPSFPSIRPSTSVLLQLLISMLSFCIRLLIRSVSGRATHGRTTHGRA